MESCAQTNSISTTILDLPPPEKLREIATRQDEKAREIRARRRQQKQQQQTGRMRDEEAATMIQKNYRGYRARRALDGYGLDSSTRWMELLKDTKYWQHTMPLSRSERASRSPPTESKLVRDRWKRIGTIAHRAGSDDISSESETMAETDEERRALRARRRAQKEARERYARVMGMEYFLELVDHKHRYGSNLRRYHGEWKKSDTHENFFYWLDYGEGKDLDLEDRPRQRLDTELVRYLSKEERKKYEVHIGQDGLFLWTKNGQPITTSRDFKDSIDGIVPVSDSTPTWREVTTGVAPEPLPPVSENDDKSLLSGVSTGSHEDSSKYTNNELHDAKGLSKLNHLSVDSIMNHTLRKTTKKNSWIFVADTSFRLYIGIKQSGAFQHSSFLRGARIFAAGLIQIKHGRISRISPLSGHYAPPLRNFREFLKSLKDAGADLSHLNTSRSYAVLLGLEAYLGIKKQVHAAEQGVRDLVDPEGKQAREEKEKDHSRSAQRERELLEAQARERRQKRSLSSKFMTTLGLREEGEKEKDHQAEGGALAKKSSR